MTIKALLKLSATFLVFLFISTNSSAINIFTNKDLVILHGDVIDGDDRKLEEALTPEIKYLVFRNMRGGGGYDTMRRMFRVVKSAKLTTVIHGQCGFLCSRVFLAGKERIFSGEGRPEMHSFRPNGAFFSDGSASSEDYAFLKSNSNIPGSLIRDYAQQQKHTLLVFPSNTKFSSGSTAYGCDGKTYFSPGNCLPLKEHNALNMEIITSDATYKSANLVESADLAKPPKTDFAKIGDAPALETIHTNCRTKDYQDFLNQEMPRAFVVSKGTCYRSNSTFFRPYKTPMDDCIKASGAENCKFYAVDDDIVFAPFK